MGKYQGYFRKAVMRRYPTQYVDLMTDTENNYIIISRDIQFASRSSNPIDRRLDFCAYFLALVKTLDSRGESFEQIREVCLEIVIDYVRPKNKLQAIAKKIPAMMIDSWIGQKLVKVFARKVSQNENKDGFIANIITDKDKTYGLGYGVDIIECGICKLFNKHNYSKYAPILCEVDAVTSGLAGLELIRSGTIANGAEKCDFRWKRR